jgi:hypothetical protein
MQFSAIFAAVLSMAVFAAAAPIGKSRGIPRCGVVADNLLEVDARQVAASGNHGMCVKSTGGNVEQIPNC